MKVNQEHNSSGDNVAGNKYVENRYIVKDDSNTILVSKIRQIKENQNLDFQDNYVIDALKECIKELIEDEQQKSHLIVPIGTIRDRYKSYLDDDTFDLFIKRLMNDGTLEVEDIQVCSTTKKTKYKISK